jgi:ATP-dependent Clp protease adaptor protein ClpS
MKFETVLSDMERAVSFCLGTNGRRPPALSYFSNMQIFMIDDDDDKDGGTGRPGVGLATRTRPKTQKPSQYKVLLLNDDYTPMEFVVHVLKAFFSMDTDQATRVMLHVHQKGVGVCGIFTYEVAETKVTQVMDFAAKNQHPLQCTLEKA